MKIIINKCITYLINKFEENTDVWIVKTAKERASVLENVITVTHGKFQ